MERCQFKEFVRQNKYWSMVIDNHVKFEKGIKRIVHFKPNAKIFNNIVCSSLDDWLYKLFTNSTAKIWRKENRRRKRRKINKVRRQTQQGQKEKGTTHYFVFTMSAKAINSKTRNEIKINQQSTQKASQHLRLRTFSM